MKKLSDNKSKNMSDIFTKDVLDYIMKSFETEKNNESDQFEFKVQKCNKSSCCNIIQNFHTITGFSALTISITCCMHYTNTGYWIEQQ